MILSYEGTSYLGWQKTKEGPSIEGALEKALCTLLSYTPKLFAASRTDSGVHATNQVVNFFVKEVPNRFIYSINCLLPKSIRAIHLEEAPKDFNATFDSIKKQYLYQICTSLIQSPFKRLTSWHYPHPLDLEAMRLASIHLIGEHDFSSFANSGAHEDKIRYIESIEISNDFFLITGKSFLYKMVRNIVGTLVYVGANKFNPTFMKELLHSRNRSLGGPSAPAHGLTLNRVFYDKSE